MSMISSKRPLALSRTDCANAAFMPSSALNSVATTPSSVTDEATWISVWACDGAGLGTSVGQGEGTGEGAAVVGIGVGMGDGRGEGAGEGQGVGAGDG